MQYTDAPDAGSLSVLESARIRAQGRKRGLLPLDQESGGRIPVRESGCSPSKLSVPPPNEFDLHLVAHNMLPARARGHTPGALAGTPPHA